MVDYRTMNKYQQMTEKQKRGVMSATSVGSGCPLFVYSTYGVPRFVNLSTVAEIYRLGKSIRVIRHTGEFTDYDGLLTDVEDYTIGSYETEEKAQDKMREFFDWLSNLESRVMIF